MEWPVRWTRSGYRYVCLEKIAWVDFRPCYRCTLPSTACARCDLKALYRQRKQKSAERQREGACGEAEHAGSAGAAAESQTEAAR